MFAFEGRRGGSRTIRARWCRRELDPEAAQTNCRGGRRALDCQVLPRQHRCGAERDRTPACAELRPPKQFRRSRGVGCASELTDECPPTATVGGIRPSVRFLAKPGG